MTASMQRVTSTASADVRPGLIGIARCVIASSSVTGNFAPWENGTMAGWTVERRPVVDLVSDAGFAQAGSDRVHALRSNHVQVPGRNCAVGGGRERDQLAESGVAVVTSRLIASP